MNAKNKPIDVTFIKDSVTLAPTECLIEDYQTLAHALKTRDWDEVQTVMECLANIIDDYATQSEYTTFKPSVSSAILMSYDNGILAKEDGTDVQCMFGRNISTAMDGGVCQCPDDCPHRNKCKPEDGELLLSNGMYYFMGDNSVNEDVFNIK